jgi:F-type H+-transporting ATPase subunit delta
MAGMRGSSTARRYAEAVFEIAERDGTVERWLRQLNDLAEAVSRPDVVRRLEDPHVPLDARAKALHDVSGKETLPQMANLLGLLLRRRRLDTLPQIAREFKRLYNRRAGVVDATATSALELDQQEVADLTKRLETMTGKKVELATTVDPGILGGIQVRIGDTLYDGSVRGRLERLRSRLESGALSP